MQRDVPDQHAISLSLTWQPLHDRWSPWACPCLRVSTPPLAHGHAHAWTRMDAQMVVMQASQTLRLSAVFGFGSVVFDDDVTDWSGEGWACRLYVTVSMGVLEPLAAIAALLAFSAVTAPLERLRAG